MYAKTKTGLTLSWNSGTLQSATNIAGPWQDLSSASSPYTISTTNPQEFFRLKP